MLYYCALCFFFLRIRRPPRSTLFPYTSSSDLISGIAVQVDLHNPVLPVMVAMLISVLLAAVVAAAISVVVVVRSEEHTSELQSQFHLVCRLLLEKKKHQ